MASPSPPTLSYVPRASPESPSLALVLAVECPLENRLASRTLCGGAVITVSLVRKLRLGHR